MNTAKQREANLYLMFNTFISTEDQPCIVKVDSIEHAKRVCAAIGYDRLQYAEVFNDHGAGNGCETLYVLQGSGLVDASHIPLF